MTEDGDNFKVEIDPEDLQNFQDGKKMMIILKGEPTRRITIVAVKERLPTNPNPPQWVSGE
jgi:hypothetical protein